MNTFDLCIALNGPCVPYLLPIAMHSLRKHDVIIDDNIHFVMESGVSSRIFDNLDGNYNCYHYNSPLRPKPDNAPFLGKDLEDERDWVWRNIDSQRWMVENCGDAEWVFIMHFDVEFKDAWLSHLIFQIDDQTAQVGAHNLGLVGYRRSALKQAHVGFDSISGLYLIKGNYGNWKVIHFKDPRCIGNAIPIEGWDTNELLELNLQHLGWKVKVETDVESNKWRTHHGSGSGRCGNSEMIIERAKKDLKRLGLEPL